MQQEFSQWSYDNQAKHFEKENDFPQDLYESWLNTNTADYWRHLRAFEAVSIFKKMSSKSTPFKWLTIGDGRLGLDSQKIRNIGFDNVLATDISEHLLKIGKRKRIIPDYRVENAEHLTFDNATFDVVFCKESLHHFPQPYKALYESLRCARLAVILIEPNDIELNIATYQSDYLNFKGKIFNLLNTKLRKHGFELVKNSFRKNKSVIPSWEASGNYMYPFNKREFLKLAYGMNLNSIYFKGLNDHYIEGCEFEKADIEESEIFREIVTKIEMKDKVCAQYGAESDLLMTIIFKLEPSYELAEELKQNGWEAHKLKANPHFN
jgi:ubiquinone/menaquinone biosynthesis C-methylase UbiE